MRLMRTDPERMVLEEFLGPSADVPPYAILSHCWGRAADEVSYQQFQAGENQTSHGYRKIVQCCRIARSQGLEWAWVDTCCIDKTSSAELSESINSMYAWYERAAVCYAFIEDLVPEAQALWPPVSSQELRALPASRWFRRGWTLQELLAPDMVYFFNSKLEFLGTRVEFATQIDGLTGIDEGFLVDKETLHRASVAQKMSWASSRQTSRDEDVAYCLLGLFHINMPLLYGEGVQGAFRRLQEAIISQSEDDSIFAWQTTLSENRGLLANHPLEFASSRYVRQAFNDDTVLPSQVTNLGVGLSVHLRRPVFVESWLGGCHRTFHAYQSSPGRSVVSWWILLLWNRWSLSDKVHFRELTLTLSCMEYRPHYSLDSGKQGRRITLHLQTPMSYFNTLPRRWSRTGTHSLTSSFTYMQASLRRRYTPYALSPASIFVSSPAPTTTLVRPEKSADSQIWDDIILYLLIGFGYEYFLSAGPELLLHVVLAVILTSWILNNEINRILLLRIAFHYITGQWRE